MSEALPATEPATLSTSGRGRFARRERVRGDAPQCCACRRCAGSPCWQPSVAEATGRLESGVSGRLLARLDVAATVIVVVAIAAAARPFVAAYLDRRNRPSYAAHLVAWLRADVRPVDPDRRRQRGDGRPGDRPAERCCSRCPVPRSAVIAADTGPRHRPGAVRRRHRGARAARDRPDHRRAVPWATADARRCCACPASSSSRGSLFVRCSSRSGRPSRSVRCRGCRLISTRSERRSRS